MIPNVGYLRYAEYVGGRWKVYVDTEQQQALGYDRVGN